MKIIRKLKDRDTLEGFADKHNLTMLVYERDDSTLHRYFCNFDHAEVKDGGALVSEHGNGNTEAEAFADYASRISGKLLVIDAYEPYRREIRVPKLTHEATV